MASAGNANETSHRGPSTTLGFVITGIYAALIGIYALLNWCKLQNLAPNEVGDCLAGIFSPVAFLWLVIGYLQQGVELRISSDELRNSVEQQKALASATQEQLQLAKLQNEPALEINPTDLYSDDKGGEYLRKEYRVKVSRSDCHNLMLVTNIASASNSPLIKPGEERTYDVSFKRPIGDDIITLHYSTLMNERRERRYVVRVNAAGDDFERPEFEPEEAPPAPFRN